MGDYSKFNASLPNSLRQYRLHDASGSLRMSVTIDGKRVPLTPEAVRRARAQSGSAGEREGRGRS